MRGLAALVFVVGCYSPPREAPCTLACTAATGCPAGLECNGDRCTLPGGACGGDDGGVDGALVDAPLDAPQPFCYGKGPDGTGPGLLRVCLDAAPAGTIVFTSQTIDTGNSSSCIPYTPGTFPPVCLVLADTITVPMDEIVRFQGSRPVVLLAPGGITIHGTIDVSSNSGRRGAGSTDQASFNGHTLCNPGSPPQARGGGAGGSFRGLGGAGGSEADTNSTGGLPGTTILAKSFVRAGCDGRSGGGTTASLGGRGGGAVYIIAGTADISGGLINASGSGGLGAVDDSGSGGGGGGSGGLIGFDVTALSNNGGILVANGGGGGCGADLGGNGNGGAAPNPLTPATPADGCGLGGNGSAGSGATNTGGKNGDSPAPATGRSGEGGGGGAGDIVFTQVTAFPSPQFGISPDARLLTP